MYTEFVSKRRTKGYIMKNTQTRLNELLYNAYVAYRECIKYTNYANSIPSEDDLFEIYDRLGTEALHECKTWLAAYAVMTDLEIPVYELAKFEDDDFKYAFSTGALA